MNSPNPEVQLLISASHNIFTNLAAKRTDVEKDVRKTLESWTPPSLKNASLEQWQESERELFARISSQLEGRKYDEFMVRWEIGNWLSAEHMKQMEGFCEGPPTEGF